MAELRQSLHFTVVEALLGNGVLEPGKLIADR